MKSYEEALLLLLKGVKKYEKIEKIAISSCLDRILAQDVYANDNYPAKATASMDGYACRYSDQDEGLKILGMLPAGTKSYFLVEKNSCVITFTGSLMSEGSDTLVPVENVSIRDEKVYINEKVSKAFAVRKVGESYKKGDLLLKKGSVLSYSELALLAQLGIFHVSVFIKPVIGVLSSGSELLDLGEHSDNPASLRSSNHIAIAALARKIGARAIIFPLLKDEVALVKKELKSSLAACDILVSTGGVSMGDFDFLKEAIKDYEIIIDKVAIKPGRHIKIAKADDKYIFALPGFPNAAMVCFTLFVRELVYSQMQREKDYKIKAYLKTAYKKKSSLLELPTCNIYYKNARVCIDLAGKKEGSSAILNNFNNKAALLIAPNDLEINSIQEVILMP